MINPFVEAMNNMIAVFSASVQETAELFYLIISSTDTV